MKNKIWATLENSTGTGSIKQHLFVPNKRGKAISVCKRIRPCNEDGHILKLEDLAKEAENLEEKRACKLCLKKFNEKSN